MICLIISTFHFTLELRIAGGKALGQLFKPKHGGNEEQTTACATSLP
jgi:hypothetical protein